ncbi:MAG TPA: S53 family peptidase [Aliidongia sp.]|nr:S53 family peptidase [Aliidongia sp.]
MLLSSTALPALAGGASVTQLMAQAQDAGPVAATTQLSGMVWLKGHQSEAFDAAVKSRYDMNSPSYHRWMTAGEVANFAPSASDLETVKASLKAQGLKIEQVSDDGAVIKVSGSAAKMQAAFGTSIRVKQAAGRSFLAAVGEPKYQGAHAELIDSVTSLGRLGMQPYAVRQIDFSTGKARAGVPAATTPDPLAIFTTQCFSPSSTTSFSAFLGTGHFLGASYIGPQYLKNEPGDPVCGYTAQQVATHYGLDTVYAQGWTGKGQTIVLIDAFGSPNITNDANTFSQVMGLPKLNNKNFEIVFPDGQPLTNGIANGWADEISLDVEWAHALAPDAKIVLVVAPTDDPAELSFALNYAVAHKLGNVISNSFGYPEAAFGPADARMFNTVIKKAAAQGIAVNVATGDSGDEGLGTPLGAASIPADSPFATAVGGTSIGIPADNKTVEAVWGITVSALGGVGSVANPPFAEGTVQGGGGGESVYLEKPSYQKSLPGTGRQLPDVSAIADPQTGAIIVAPNQGTGETEFGVIGGTSLATPVFSAIWALADQAAGESLGQAAPIIAKMSSAAVTDIVPISVTKAKDNLTGTVTETLNGVATVTTYSAAQILGLDQTQPEGFVGTMFQDLLGFDAIGFGADSSLMTATGWDNATGWGVPNGLKFINEAKKAAKGKLS